MTAKHDGWCLRSPSGKLIVSTFCVDQDDCWHNSYLHLSNKKWMQGLWKQWDASIEAARKRGWVMVRAKVVKLK